MRRRNFSKESMNLLKQAYKTVYMRGLKLEDALAQLEARESDPLLTLFIKSIRASRRGIAR